MRELLQVTGFILLFLRFSYWIGLSLTIQEKKWKWVVFSQCAEAFLLFLIATQLFGKKNIFPMHQDIWVVVAGFLLVVIGVVGAFAAKRQLGNLWVYAAASRVTPKQKLVTSGVYKIVRHPIYAGFVVSYVGMELLMGSWLWISFLFFFIPFFLQAKKEETLLVAHFGKKYTDYQLRTKMLIPFVL